MGRLIKLESGSKYPSNLAVKVGDVLLASATGGRVGAGIDRVTLMGPFIPGTIGDDGKVYSPAGSPNAIMIVALQAGRAVVELVSGDPWSAPQRRRLEITISP